MVTHFSINELALCNTVAKKNPLELTVDKTLVTCKKCLKKIESLKKEALEVIEDQKKLDEVVEDVEVPDVDIEYEEVVEE